MTVVSHSGHELWSGPRSRCLEKGLTHSLFETDQLYGFTSVPFLWLILE